MQNILTTNDNASLIEEIQSKLNYNPSTGIFTHRRNGKEAGTTTTSGYRQLWFNNKTYPAHRVAYLLTHGVWPLEIDHRNRIKTDNRIENLRDVTHQTNLKNRGSWSRSGHKGVSYDKRYNRYVAQITIDGEHTTIGSFKEIEDASKAYQAFIKNN